MNECFKCGILGDKALLMDAISDKGIVKICRKCSVDEDIPLIRKPSIMQLKEPEKKQTVYERLSKVAGIKDNVPENRELKKQETSLKEIIDKRFKTRFKETKSHHDLIDNFHWVLMRVRRLRKITPEQLAEKINESPHAIKMAERGVLGEDYLKLIRKLEDYLNVKLIKEEFTPREKKPIEVVDSELLGKPEEIFEIETSRQLTISDLKKIKEKREAGIFEVELSPFEEELIFNESVKDNDDSQEFVKRENSLDEQDSNAEVNSEEDLTKEEIDRILFGKGK